jgi:hypothetical protein
MEREKKRDLNITLRVCTSMEPKIKAFSNTTAIYMKEISKMMLLRGKELSQPKRVDMLGIFIMGCNMVMGNLVGRMVANIEGIM